MTLLGLQVTPSELAVGLCPASPLKLLFHGLILSPPISAGGWRSGATPEGVGPQRAPQLCPLSPRTLGPTSTNRTERGRCILGASGAFPDALVSPEASGGATALQPLPQHLPHPLSQQSCHSWGGMQGEAGADPQSGTWGSVAAQEPTPGAISKASSCLSASNICQSLRAPCQGSSAAIPELIPRPKEMRIFQQESSERVYFSVSPLGLFH